MDKKKLSIITINLNNKAGLQKTIESVTAQNYKDFEFIVIDGGSTDGSLDVIKANAGKIDHWVSETDKGVYQAMNKGVLAAGGNYCNFMNSGDCFYDQSVLQNVFSDKPVADILIGRAKTPYRIIEPPGNPSLAYFYNRQPINHQAAFIKRDLLLKYPYDETTVKIVSDWKFFLQALVIENCSYKAINTMVVNFDPEGMGSANLDVNLAEQQQVINALVSPRILEDYSMIQYKDSRLVRLAIPLATFADHYGRYLNPRRYFKRIAKIIQK